MKKCPICSKKIDRAYNTEHKDFSRLEKSCYKCSTVINYIFEGSSLKETVVIMDGLKLEINHEDKTSTVFRRHINECPPYSGYVAIKWISLVHVDEEIEFDLENLKELKRKLETMVLFS